MANFYRCDDCGSIVLDIANGNVCEGAGLELMHPRQDGEFANSHLPRAGVENGSVVVRVGEKDSPHPMTEEDYIQWVYVQTSYGGVYCYLQPGDEPTVRLSLNRDEVKGLYAYSKAHGLWKAKDPVLPMDFEQNLVACSPEFTLGCVDMTME